MIEFNYETIAAFDDGTSALEIGYGNHPEVGEYGNIVMFYDGRVISFQVETQQDVDKLIKALKKLKEKFEESEKHGE